MDDADCAMRWILPFVLCLGLLALAPPVASQEARHGASGDWRTLLAEALQALEDPDYINEANCATVISAFTEPFYYLPSSAFVPKSARAIEELRAEGPRLLGAFFHARLLLKERFHAFTAPSMACIYAVRRALRYSRFAEDFLADWLHDQGVVGSTPSGPFSGGYPHTMRNPQFPAIRFEVGDVVVLRNSKVNSAMIARLGDEEGDYSHLGLVTKDSTGRKYVVEALVEKGTIITPLDKFLAEKSEGRAMLLRYRDRALAARAGRAMLWRAALALARGAAIPYNYRFDDRVQSQLYCAQVLEYAYDLASHGRVRPPRYRTSLHRLAGTPFLRQLGVYVPEVISPSDVELDARFDTVAEWSNIATIRGVRMDNVSLTALYNWFAHGYAFLPNPMTETLAHMGVALIRTGLVSSFTQRHVPEQTLVVLMKTHTVITDYLKQVLTAADRQHRLDYGHSLTFRELLVVLEIYRRNDCITSRSPMPSQAVTLHRQINVAGGRCPIHLNVDRPSILMSEQEGDGAVAQNDNGPPSGWAVLKDEREQIESLH
jgi:hypothetical protein